MQLLYDCHCYVCSLATLLLTKLSRGFVRPIPIESSGVDFLKRVAPHSRRRLVESSWLVSDGVMQSGLRLIPTALLGVLRGRLHGLGSKSKIQDLYSRDGCALGLPCSGLSGLVKRTMYFVASNSEVRFNSP